MMYQGKNHYADGYDALQAMCESHKSDQIAHYLIHTNGIWRGKSLPTGSSRLRACLSAEKNEFLSLGEIIAIMQFTGRCDPLYFVCDLLGMTRPVSKSPEEQVAHLTGVIEQAGEAMAAGIRMLEALNRAGDSRNVIDFGNGAKFCMDSDKSGSNF